MHISLGKVDMWKWERAHLNARPTSIPHSTNTPVGAEGKSLNVTFLKIQDYEVSSFNFKSEPFKL
jgi:hypothetical protein